MKSYERHIRENCVFLCNMSPEERRDYFADEQKKDKHPKVATWHGGNYETRLALIDRSSMPYGTREQRERFYESLLY